MGETTGQAHEGGTLLFAGTTVDILVPASRTAGAFALLRVATPPGCWTPPHLHRDEDETLFILSGTLRAETEHHATDLAPGHALVLPRGQAHRLGNVGTGTAHVLLLCTPGGFEGFVRAAGRPLPAEGPAMTEADIAALVEAAPRHGIELLAPGSLHPATSAPPPAAPEPLDVFGVTVQVLAELGSGDDDLCLIRGRVPPGLVVPLHSHGDREVLCVLDGTLEASIGPAGEASWRTFGAGSVADIGENVPHALRNAGDRTADTLLVTTRRIAGLFRETGCPVGAAPPGPPSRDRLEAFVAASNRIGYRLGSEWDNAAIGLHLG